MDEIFESLFNKYAEEHTIPDKIKINVSIVENINKSATEFLKKYGREISDDNIIYNGTTCFPREIDEPIEIYISKKEVENCKTNNAQFICTFFHELTHAIDFYNYCEKYCSSNYDNLLTKSSAYGFRMWTEFNAKNISYLLYMQIVKENLYNSDESLKMILDEELPFQNQYLIDTMSKYDINIAIYEIVLYLGRYSIWEKLFKKTFGDGKLFPTLLSEKTNPELLNLYNMLKNGLDEEKYYCELQKSINLLKGKLIKNKIV